jgi:hypothetical protein
LLDELAGRQELPKGRADAVGSEKNRIGAPPENFPDCEKSLSTQRGSLDDR